MSYVLATANFPWDRLERPQEPCSRCLCVVFDAPRQLATLIRLSRPDSVFVIWHQSLDSGPADRPFAERIALSILHPR